jgi:hypothetical protein
VTASPRALSARRAAARRRRQTLGSPGADVAGEQPRPGDARGVCRDRDRHAQERQDNPCPSPRLAQLSDDDRQRKQRHQRANSAARLGHLQRRRRKHEDVALAQYRDAGQIEDAFARARRQQLQGKRDLIEENGRQRDRQRQKRDGKREQSQPPPTAEEQHRARDDADERHACEEEFRAEEPREQYQQADADNSETGVRWRERCASERRALLPYEPRGEGHDQEPVRIVLVARPLSHERRDDGSVDDGDGRDDDPDRDQRPSVRHRTRLPFFERKRANHAAPVPSRRIDAGSGV